MRAQDVASGFPAVAESKKPQSSNRSDVETSSIKINLNDVIIIVMGATGSGKSTFINHFGGRAEIGHGLESCTGSVQPYMCPSFHLPDGQRLFLVDTPGFDDSSRTDADVLCDIACFLSSTYQNNRLLAGIIYLHRISDSKVRGSVLRQLRIFKKMCGETHMKSVVIATAMWNVTSPTLAQYREQELISQDVFFKQMLDMGVKLMRQDQGIVSATTIVQHLISARSRTVLDIQSELVDQGKRLDETAAGQIVEAELCKSQKMHEEEVEELKREIQDAISKNDTELVGELARIKKEIEHRLRQEQDALKTLKQSHIDLIRRTQQRHRQRSHQLQSTSDSQDESQRSVTQLLSSATSLNLVKESESQHASESYQCDALEIKTKFSDKVSVDTTKRDNFIHWFAGMLQRDVNQQLSDGSAEIEFSDKIEELLADFAARIGQGDESPELRRWAMILIYTYRSSISRAFLSMTTAVPDEGGDTEISAPDRLPFDEVTQLLHERDSNAKDQRPITQKLANDDMPSEEILDGLEKDLYNYECLLMMTSAYKWLIASVQNIFLLKTIMHGRSEWVRMKTYEHVANPINLSRSMPPMLTEGHFEMKFNDGIIDYITDSIVLDSMLTVTGSEQEAQAMTCSQYIQQTWPTNGMSLWRLTKHALLNPEELVSTQDIDNTYISARFSYDELTVVITGVRGVLVEAAEQLCWTCGALDSAISTYDRGILVLSPLLTLTSSEESTQNRAPSSSLQRESSKHIAGMRGCINCREIHRKCDLKRPSCNRCDRTRVMCRWASDLDSFLAAQLSPLAISTHKAYDTENSPAVVHFKVYTTLGEPCTTSQDGTCWYNLFRRCLIIRGFPIRRRPKSKLGLELSLDLMAELIGTKRLHQFDERLFFKRFFMMLTPSSRDGDLLIWHLCKSRDGDRISYLDHKMRDPCKCDFNDLLKVRHIVGWCSNIKHLAGHVAACYSVESSFLEASPPSGSLFNCFLSSGRPVSGGSNVYFSSNHQPVSASQRNYLDMFRFLERRPTLFWDSGTSRGWLMNGLRALLHVLRQSFKIDENEDLGGMFVLKPEDLLEPKKPFSARAAREFLNNPNNMSAKVSISTVRGTEYVYETLSERFERIYDVLEQAFDYQSKRRNWDQIPRSHLEGWDFVSVAKRDDTIPPSMVLLPTIGKGWVDFIRATGAITLIGDGFGDLMQSGTAMCDSVPCDRFCLAVSVSDLSDIVRSNRCKLNTKPSLICRTPSIIWHSPSGSSKQCACVVTEGSSSNTTDQKCVQVMWPAGGKALLPKEDDRFTLEGQSNGAVIFGHDDSLKHYIPDFGPIPQPGPPPQTSKEFDVVDSGIGSSIDSVSSGLEKVSTRSTLSPFDDSQSAVAFANNQCNSYGSSFMSGGYGVYGNVTGNFSVNQYFGSIPGQDTEWSSVPPTPLLKNDAGSKSQKAGESETQASLLGQHIPLLNSEQQEEEEQNSTDLEMQEGLIEMRDLGLEDYCHLFRC